ncbi:hypothetical protein ACH4ZX_32905 [Streptomyces sp. NPDC020490]|uniref:hypothetical protein n=1 Tax=Streptomyces sp. NPDC020490 TaxID=3365078 RepID=UPI0037A9424A
MPRGRHRHSPPLHRLLPPSAIAGVSLVCALGPWVFWDPAALRVTAAIAAATAAVGAAVMRRWDVEAGKRVADLTRARASDEWRHEERVAELETDLEESRALRAKLEQRLRAKRSELAGLRNEHAALLRRYATAETERASALEGRRLLEIETTTDTPATRALPPVPVPRAEPVEAARAVAAPAEAAENAAENADEKAAAPGVFSPEGAELFLRADAALTRFAGGGARSEDDAAAGAESGEQAEGAEAAEAEAAEGTAEEAEGSKVAEDAAEDAANDAEDTGDAEGAEASEQSKDDSQQPKQSRQPKRSGNVADSQKPQVPPASVEEDGAAKGEPVKTGAAAVEAAQEDEAQGKPEAADGHERAAATTTGKPNQPVQQPSGHFVAPTAVAVVPPAPVRRPAVEGGFDFFGTKGQPSQGAALENVHNEDLADVVGQEALALHKADAESEFKPADEESRGVGQVIDLTAHDETEPIKLQGLRNVRSAVS